MAFTISDGVIKFDGFPNWNHYLFLDICCNHPIFMKTTINILCFVKYVHIKIPPTFNVPSECLGVTTLNADDEPFSGDSSIPTPVPPLQWLVLLLLVWWWLLLLWWLLFKMPPSRLAICGSTVPNAVRVISDFMLRLKSNGSSGFISEISIIFGCKAAKRGIIYTLWSLYYILEDFQIFMLSCTIYILCVHFQTNSFRA